jgi:hypothetical protein
MAASSNTRSIGLAGLASFACLIAAALVAPPLWEAPGSTASAETIVSYVQADRGRFLVSLFGYGVAIGLFLCFAAGLAVRLRASESSAGVRSAVFAAGAVVLVALIFASFAPAGVNAYRTQPPALAQALYDATFALLAVSGIPTAVCLGAYAALVLPAGPLPRWTGGLALLGALAHVLIAASMLFDSGFLSLEGGVIVAVPATFFAWILATSVTLLRARERGSSSAT